MRILLSSRLSSAWQAERRIGRSAISSFTQVGAALPADRMRLARTVKPNELGAASPEGQSSIPANSESNSESCKIQPEWRGIGQKTDGASGPYRKFPGGPEQGIQIPCSGNLEIPCSGNFAAA